MSNTYNESPDKNTETHSIASYRFSAMLFLLSLTFLFFVVAFFHPATGGPGVVLLFLLGIFFCFLSGLYGTLRLILSLIGKPRTSRVRIFYTSVAIATGVVFLIGLQTLRQLQVIDIVLVVLFEVVLNFYLLRRF